MTFPISESILRFESFVRFENIVHFTTTRHGGVSGGAFESFNMSCRSGDTKENADANRGILCRALGLNPDRLFVPHQVHDTEIAVIDRYFLNTGKEQQIALLAGKDALLTSLEDVCIAVLTADCVPILLYAADNRVIGAVHAGWRGTCRRIVQKAVERMVTDYGCRPSQIYAAAGPSIGPEAFEVGREVVQAFRESGFDPDSVAFVNPLTGKHHIDLWEANRQQLTASGVPSQQIEIAGICTCRNSDRFFSARKAGICSGRMLTGICMV